MKITNDFVEFLAGVGATAIIIIMLDVIYNCVK